MYSVFALPPDVDYEVTADFRGQVSPRKLVSSFLDREDNVLNFQIDVAVTAGAVADDNGPTFQTLDRVQLKASFEMPTGVPAPIPAVLLLHGFGEDRSVWQAFRRQLLNLGYAVMSLDLRGHGQSTTKNSVPVQASQAWRTTSLEFPQDLDPALDWLKAQPRLEPRKIVVIGYDVGANLALLASGQFPEVRTVVAVSQA
jgi:pimeloyl-ACP methyl ester carboxylesterase